MGIILISAVLTILAVLLGFFLFFLASALCYLIKPKNLNQS